MRILFIGKRFYTNRDAYVERFGRIYQLPYWWAEAGHEVDLWLVDYHGHDSSAKTDGSLAVETTPVFRTRFLARFFAACFGPGSSKRPDVIVASGDCYIGFLAFMASVLSGAKFVFDVYDRYDVFEGYRRLPGLDPFDFLLRRSEITTFASITVLRDFQHLSKKTLLVRNGFDPKQFSPLSMQECRVTLGLPADGLLVGYFGSVEPELGISDLIDALAILRDKGMDAELLIGGEGHPDVDLNKPWVRYLGNIPFENVPAALASCDVLALPYRQGDDQVDNGLSCKIAEYIAMERPIVATRSPMLIQNFPEQLAQLEDLVATPGDVADLAASVASQLGTRRLVDMPRGMSWQAISSSVQEAIEQLVAGDAVK